MSNGRNGTGDDVQAGTGKGGAAGITQPGAGSSTLQGSPGQIVYGEGPVVMNPGRPVSTVSVLNTADRPISVGSHYHFAEANPALDFDREAAWGQRMNILAGAMLRFDPGATVQVQLVPLAGQRIVRGLRGQCAGPLDG
jgi:urease subunit beta